MEQETLVIKSKFITAGFPLRFVNSVIKDFETKSKTDARSEQKENEKIIYRLRLPFCEGNEKLTSKFTQRLNQFTGNSFKYFILWNTRNVRSLFPLKDQKIHQANVIYEGNCNCPESYIGETGRNDVLRFQEHADIRKDSQPARHLLTSTGHHEFSWKIIRNVSRNREIREIIESFFIKTRKPSLNKEIKQLILFNNGIT